MTRRRGKGWKGMGKEKREGKGEGRGKEEAGEEGGIVQF